MNRKARLWRWTLTCAVILLCAACSCNDGTPTVSKDRTRRMAAVVWAGSPPSPPLLDHDDWKDLDVGDVVKTDADGQAELRLVGCSGSLYVFSNTQIQVAPCTEEEMLSGVASCTQQGTGYFNIDCTGRFTVDTLAGQVTVAATTFSVTYLPDEQLLLVVVFEGRVGVWPVIDLDTGELAEKAIPVAADQFLYTIPGPESPELLGVPARKALPLKGLPPLVDELRIGYWIDDLEMWAEKDRVLPADWPFAVQPGVLNVALQSGGGALENVLVQRAVLTAIDKDAIARSALSSEGIRFTGLLEGEEVDTRAFAYDPDKARALLRDADYGNGFGATLVFPEDDEQLAAMALTTAENMEKVGLKVTTRAVPAGELRSYVEGMLKEGVAVLWLERR